MTGGGASAIDEIAGAGISDVPGSAGWTTGGIEVGTGGTGG